MLGVAVELDVRTVRQLNATWLSLAHFKKRSPFFLRVWTASTPLKRPLHIFVSRVDPLVPDHSASTVPRWTTVKTKVGPNWTTWDWLHGESRRGESFFDWNSSSQHTNPTQLRATPERPATTPIMDFASKQSLRTQGSPTARVVKRWRCGGFARRVPWFTRTKSPSVATGLGLPKPSSFTNQAKGSGIASCPKTSTRSVEKRFFHIVSRSNGQQPKGCVASHIAPDTGERRQGTT